MSVINTKDTTSIDDNRTMDTSDSLVYRVATTSDCDSLTSLINNSYRGELSYQGWTNENELIPVSRTSPNALFNMINENKYIVLMFFGEKDQILKGCISILHESEFKTAQLSMFAVRPDLQGRGYGKFILSIAENYAINNWNVQSIELNTIIQRPELMEYYTRRGFVDTGRRQPFPKIELKPEMTMRDDIEIATMRKSVKNDENKTV